MQDSTIQRLLEPDTNRRKFLMKTGAVATAALAGCSGDRQTSTGTSTASATATDTPTATPTATPEPDYPVRIEQSDAPSIEEEYNPSEWMPEGGWEAVANKDIEIDSSMNRTEQLKELLYATTNYARATPVYKARVGAAAAWEELDWADHDNMMIDIVTLGGGSIFPGIEITYQKQNGEHQIDLLPTPISNNEVRELYTENAPQSPWHDGQRAFSHFVDWGLWEDLNISEYSDARNTEELLHNGTEIFSNLAPGVNANSHGRFDDYEGDVEKVVMGENYLKGFSHIFDTDPETYMQLKQDKARAMASTRDQNALGVHINENGERVMEELTLEQYDEAAPFFYHWKSKNELTNQ